MVREWKMHHELDDSWVTEARRVGKGVITLQHVHVRLFFIFDACIDHQQTEKRKQTMKRREDLLSAMSS